MPTYKVTDPSTGRVLRLTGDSPPTEQELEQVFSSVKESAPKTPKSQFDSVFSSAVKAGLKTLDPTGLSQTRAVEAHPEVLPIAMGAAGAVSPVPGGGALGAGTGELLRQGIQITKNQPGAPTSVTEGVVRTGSAALPFIAGPLAGRAASVLPMLQGPIAQGIIQGGAGAAAPSAALQTFYKGQISPKETLSDAAKGATSGGLLNALLPMAMGGMGGSRVGAPKIPQERLEGITAAAEEGVPLTAADVTGGRGVSLMESGLHRTPLGSGPIQRFRKEQLAKIEQIKERLGQSLGTDEPSSVVGSRMKEHLQKELQARKAISQETYGARDKLIPPNAPVPLNAAEKTAQTILYRQSKLPPSERDPGLTSVASDVLNRQGRMDFEALDILRQSVGSKADQTFSGKEYLSLVKSIDADLDSFASKLPGNPAALTKTAKEQYKSFKQLEENPSLQALQKQNPEDVVPALFGRRKTTEIRALKAELPGAFESGKKAFTSQLLHSPNLSKELSKFDPETLSEIYPANELAQIKRLSKIKDLTQTAEKLAGNPSGTAQVVTTNLSMAPMLDFLTNPIGSVAKTALAFGGPAAASRAYLSRSGTSALTRGLPVPTVGQGAGTALKTALIQGLLQRKLKREESKPREGLR